VLQTTDKITIRKLLVHLIGPTSNLPWDKVEEDGNCLARSSFDLQIQNLPWIRNLGGISKPRLIRKHPGVRGRRSLAVGDLREKQARGVPGVP